MSLEREFQYSDKNFQFLKKKVKQFAGIDLSDAKNEMVYSRISRLLRQYHITSFDEYCNKLKENDSQMVKEFINAITTNYTTFMREPYHFDYLTKTLLPLLKATKHDCKKIRIWSAGCSTGEEAYSISFSVGEVFNDYADWDIKILATDVDSDALHKAEQAIYSEDMVNEIPSYFKTKLDYYFDIPSNDKKIFIVKNKFRKFVHFKNFNLMSASWPMHGPFDLIFCRNVIIYFDRPTQESVITKFGSLLSENGYLILGPSEAVLQALLSFKRIEGTIYRKNS